MATTSLKIISRVNDGVYSEFWTPQWILESAYQVLGEVDLDPAAVPGGNWTRAHAHYTYRDNGLGMQWHGRIWLNPPYGKHIGIWTAKLQQEYKLGHVQEAILLVPAKCETKWFQPLLDFPVCLLKGRVRFRTPFGKTSETQQLFGSALVYFGHNTARFAEVFSKRGRIITSYR